MSPPVPLAPYIYILGVYLALQVVLNLFLRYVIRQHDENRAVAMLLGTFWAGVVNAVFFIIAAVMLHVIGAAPNVASIPGNVWLLALSGIPAGVALWYISVQARKLGIALFGGGELIAGEDAILRIPPHPRYITAGMLNLGVLQPLGREFFMRGALLPAVAAVVAQNSTEIAGWLWAILVVLVLELLLRMNVVWMFQTLAYALIMCGLFILTGCALTGLVAAMVNGMLHGMALAYMGQQDLKRKLLELSEEAQSSTDEPTE